MPQSDQSDPIQEFMALPRDQQMSTLQNLSPDKQDKLLAKVKEYRQRPAPSTPQPSLQDRIDQRIHDFTQRKSPSDFARTDLPAPLAKIDANLESTTQNIARSALGVVASAANHPLQSLGGMWDIGKELLFSPLPLPNKEGIAANLDYAANDKGPLAEQVKDFQETYKRSPREAIENLTGDLLGMYLTGELLDAVGKPVKMLGGKTMEKLTSLRENARTGTQSMIGAGTQAVKKAVGSAAESAGESAKSTEEANRAELRRHDNDVQDAGQKDVNAHVQYLQEKAAAEQENEAAREIPNSRAGLEKVIDDKSWLRQQRIEAAEKAAKKDLDKRYEKQRELLGDESIPPSSEKGALTSMNVGERTVEAFQSFITNPEVPMPKTIKMLSERAGHPLGWSELSGLRSEIGKQLSGGHLNGEVFKGYKAALSVVDDGLQKIADNFGVGDVVKKNRADYAHFADTFYDPISEPNTIARKTQTATSPEYMRTSEEAERREALDKYDKSIGRLGNEIDSLSRRLSSLPSEGTRPTAKVPEYPQPTEVTPPRTKPIETPDVSTRAIRENLLDRWTSGESQLSKFQVRSLIGGGLGAIVGGIFEGKLGAGVGGAIGSVFGPAAIAKVVELPAVREWLTRPPAGELETLQKLPYTDRIKLTDGLKQVVQKAQTQGVKVSPAVIALVGASAFLGPKTSQIQKIADDSRSSGNTYLHTAKNADGHVIGSNDGTTWFDTQTGAPVGNQ